MKKIVQFIYLYYLGMLFEFLILLMNFIYWIDLWVVYYILEIMSYLLMFEDNVFFVIECYVDENDFMVLGNCMWLGQWREK